MFVGSLEDLENEGSAVVQSTLEFEEWSKFGGKRCCGSKISLIMSSRRSLVYHNSQALKYLDFGVRVKKIYLSDSRLSNNGRKGLVLLLSSSLICC